MLLLLTLTIATLLVGVSAANAQELPKRSTHPYLGVNPNPTSVGQTVYLHVGIAQPTQTASEGWENLKVEIIRPDNSTEHITNIRTDSTGGTACFYTPTMPGTYRLRTIFPEQVYRNVIYLASASDWVELVVQSEPLPFYPSLGLPTEYWTRPIDDQLREWYSIAGSWLAIPANLYAPYNDGPESPHILWAKPITTGGLIGGEYEEHSFEMGDAYEGKWVNPIILAGKLYYRDHSEVESWQQVVCVDLHTGEEMWRKTFLDNRTIARGQILYWDAINLHGAYDYLWVTIGTTWLAFDAWTGELVYNMTNVPSGTIVYGPKGEILIYTINLARGFMLLWNSTNIPALWMGTTEFGMGSWRPHGKTVNATGSTGTLDYPANMTVPLGLNGYMWNKTIPTGLLGSVRAVWTGDRVVGSFVNQTLVNVWALSLKPGQEGTLLFNKNWNPPANWLQDNLSVTWMAQDQYSKVGVVSIKETRQHFGFSLETGDCLWGPTQSEHYMNMYGLQPGGPVWAYSTCLIAEGKLFSTGFSGIVYCYDAKTGKLLWTYEAKDPYAASEMFKREAGGSTWPLRIMFVTDGKIYLGTFEHSPDNPMARGAPFICLDVETGEEIWRADGFFRQTNRGGTAIIGDSIIATQDTYDQRVYAIGRGPSTTTVTATPEVVANGQSILIKGTVMDVSPGTKDSRIALRFPNGVPAVADENMSEWMLYVYKQFPRPANVKGVWVTFDVIGPDGKWEHVGGTTTDDSGMFSIPWKPPKEGLWTIVITFPGSKSYYPSYARTSILVEPAPPTPETPQMPEIPTIPDYTLIFAAIIALVIIAILIGAYSIYDHRKLKK